MNKIIIIDSELENDFKNCELENFNYIYSDLNLENIKLIFDKNINCRIAVIGKNLFELSSKLVKKSGLCTVQIFSYADAIESPKYNNANLAFIDMIELNKIQAIKLLSIWLNSPEWKSDGFHD